MTNVLLQVVLGGGCSSQQRTKEHRHRYRSASVKLARAVPNHLEGSAWEYAWHIVLGDGLRQVGWSMIVYSE
jgi:hypothetical protein